MCNSLLSEVGTHLYVVLLGFTSIEFKALYKKMLNQRVRRTYTPKLRSRPRLNLAIISPPLIVTRIADGALDESGRGLPGSCSSSGLSDTMVTLQIVRLTVILFYSTTFMSRIQ